MTNASTSLIAHIQAVGVLGPGLGGWPVAAAVLRGEQPYQPQRTQLPPPEALPPAERRRAGRVVRLALAVAQEAIRDRASDARELTSVFCSSGGDGDTCHEICEALAGTERSLSPTRFHNSVHNAPAGYWSIAHGCMRPSTSLCAYDGSFAAGLLEALTQLREQPGPLLLVAYDLDYPPPVKPARPIPDAFGIALLLCAEPTAAGATVAAQLTHEPASTLADRSLESLRRTIPAARGLTVLEPLAAGRRARIVVDYLDEVQLAVQVSP